MSEFLDEQTKGLVELVETFRKARVTAARKAALESAARIRTLNQRVRDLARSGVRLSSISQETAERLIELESDIVTSALDDAAAQLQRIAATEHVRDLARDQAEVLQATRQRIVDDITRALTILKGAAGEARAVAKRATAAKPATSKRPVRRKTGRAAAKPPRKKRAARKPQAKARAKRSVRAKHSR